MLESTALPSFQNFFLHHIQQIKFSCQCLDLTLLVTDNPYSSVTDFGQLALLGVHGDRWTLCTLVRARGQLNLLRRPRIDLLGMGYKLNESPAAKKRFESD